LGKRTESLEGKGVAVGASSILKRERRRERKEGGVGENKGEPLRKVISSRKDSCLEKTKGGGVESRNAVEVMKKKKKESL